MSHAKELLEAATPLPWSWVEPHGITGGDQRVATIEGLFSRRHANGRLVLHAVNRLPDYEAAVEALDYIESRLRPEGRRGLDVNDAYTMAVGALARLREKVPA